MTLCRKTADLAAQGLSPEQIAAALNVPRSTVYERLRYAAKRRRPVQVSAEAWEALEGHAAARRLSVPSLINELLVTAVLDDMVGAILDDGISTPNHGDTP